MSGYSDIERVMTSVWRQDLERKIVRCRRVLEDSQASTTDLEWARRKIALIEEYFAERRATSRARNRFHDAARRLRTERV